jgi:hypothetical protein
MRKENKLKTGMKNKNDNTEFYHIAEIRDSKYDLLNVIAMPAEKVEQSPSILLENLENTNKQEGFDSDIVILI